MKLQSYLWNNGCTNVQNMRRFYTHHFGLDQTEKSKCSDKMAGPYLDTITVPSWGVSSPPPSPAEPPPSWPGVSPPSPPALAPAPPWSGASPPHSAPSAWWAPSRGPGAPRAATDKRRNRVSFCPDWPSPTLTLDMEPNGGEGGFGTCSSLITCCLCCSLAAWLWLSSASLSSSSRLIFSFSLLCSWSRFLMVASWDIWVACREPIWPGDSQIKPEVTPETNLLEKNIYNLLVRLDFFDFNLCIDLIAKAAFFVDIHRI